MTASAVGSRAVKAFAAPKILYESWISQ